MRPATTRLLYISLLSVGLAACGSGDNSTGGSLIQNPAMKAASYGPSDLLATLGGGDVGQLLLQLAFSPKCSIDIFIWNTNTVGGGGEPTTASRDVDGSHALGRLLQGRDR